MAPITTVFSLLDEEWDHLEHSRQLADGLRAWAATEPCLARFASVADLVAHVRSRRGAPGEADVVLLALVRHAAAEPLAARVLLQLLLPGCKALARRYAWTSTPDEMAAAIVNAAYERIRTYPLERRPGRVAANVLGDVRQRVLLDLGVSRREFPVADVEKLRSEDEEPFLSSSEELLRVLSWAVEQQGFPEEGARLIAMTRVADASVVEISAGEGIAPHSLRQRRLRFEHLLRERTRTAQAVGDHVAA